MNAAQHLQLALYQVANPNKICPLDYFRRITQDKHTIYFFSDV